MNLIYTVQVLKFSIVLYLFFINTLHFYLAKHTISPFYYNDKNKTIHPFDLQSLKSLQLWTASWARRASLVPLDGGREQGAVPRRRSPTRWRGLHFPRKERQSENPPAQNCLIIISNFMITPLVTWCAQSLGLAWVGWREIKGENKRWILWPLRNLGRATLKRKMLIK